MQGVLKPGEPYFPEWIHIFMPRVKELYYEGNLQLLTTRTIGVVGSRRCTQYGKTVAKAIGERAALEGVTLVSGLAKGIDTAGHQGVLQAGGNTIAVVGGGTSYYYPIENKVLQQQIGREGLLLSLHPPGYKPQPFDFPIRNEVISSLSENVVVVEAGRESGALITAEYAGGQGKNVYAVPGNITSHYSFGTNQLIREGANPLICIDDVFLDMGLGENAAANLKIDLGDDEKEIFHIICDRGQITVDEIYHKTNMKLSEINGIITILEMKGLIFSSLGKIFVAKFR